MKIIQISNVYIDDNKNKWTIDQYTEKQAEKASENLENCSNCVNCENCIDCCYCVNCEGCDNCDNCANCVDCVSCAYISGADCEGGVYNYPDIEY